MALCDGPDIYVCFNGVPAQEVGSREAAWQNKLSGCLHEGKCPMCKLLGYRGGGCLLKVGGGGLFSELMFFLHFQHSMYVA